MSAMRWSDVRDKHVGAIGEQDVEQGKTRLLAQVRAHRLAEMRKRRGLTQRQVAQAMGVTVGRVSQIENGELDTNEVATLSRYARALGPNADHLRLRERPASDRVSGLAIIRQNRDLWVICGSWSVGVARPPASAGSSSRRSIAGGRWM